MKTEPTKIVIEKDGRLWRWSIFVNGEEHKGGKPMPTPGFAADAAQHMLSSVGWSENRGKPDNGASIDKSI